MGGAKRVMGESSAVKLVILRVVVWIAGTKSCSVGLWECGGAGGMPIQGLPGVARPQTRLPIEWNGSFRDMGPGSL